MTEHPSNYFRPFPKKAIFRRNPVKVYTNDDFKEGEVIYRVGPDPNQHYAYYTNEEGKLLLVHFDEILDYNEDDKS